MQHTRTKYQMEGFQRDVIGGGLFDNVYFGSSSLAVNIDCRSVPFLRFGLFYDQNITFAIQGSWNNVTFFNVEVLALAASTPGSVYNLPAPRNQDGVYVLQWPYVQFRIDNTAGAATTVQRCYVVLQNYR